MSPSTSATSYPGVEPTAPLRSGAGISTVRGILDGRPVVVRQIDLRRTDGVRWSRIEHDLDADRVTLVRPFVAGPDFLTWAVAGPDDQALVRAVRELFLGPAYLHRHGLVHGGLKPANAVVIEAAGRLTLVDALVSAVPFGAPTRRSPPPDLRDHS